MTNGKWGDELPPPAEPGGPAVTIEAINGYFKMGTGSQGHIIFTDEPPDMPPGKNWAPRPLDYFAMGMGFCHLTQVERYAQALKIEIKSAKMYVRMNISRSGSVLGQTMKAECHGFDVRLEIESDAPPEKIASCLRNAENACFAVQAVLNPTPISETLVVNGQEFSLEDFPAPATPAKV